MKKILLLGYLFIAYPSFASDWEFSPVPGFRHSVKLSADYFFQSDAITNQFALAYFRNEFLDDSKKNKVTRNLSSANRFGTGFKAEVAYSRYNDTLFGLPHSYYSVSVSENYHINCSFKKDVFELYFRGNKNYAGKKALIGDFIFNQLVYNQVKFTFGHEYKFKDDKFGYLAGIGFNAGRKFYKIESPDASLFTDINGEYLDLDADIDIHRSDSVEANYPSGYGGAMDFSFYWKNKKDNKLTVSVQNFGFINWNKESSFTHADTSFRFEGIDISDIFLLTDTIRKPISLDSSLVEPYLSTREKKSFSSLLPCLLSVHYRRILTPGKLDIEGGISFLAFAGAIPAGSLMAGYSFNEYSRFAVIGKYGGYAGFRAGLSYNFLLAKRWMFALESDDLSEMFRPGGKAQGAFVSLSAYF